MKFKVGDKVKVIASKKDLKGRKQYTGKIFTIKSLNPNGSDVSAPHYGVKEDYCPFIFYENELEKVFPKSDLKDGMVIEHKNGKKRLVTGNLLLGLDGYGYLYNYQEDLHLIEAYDNKDYDCMNISKVYLAEPAPLCSYFMDSNLTLIWEKKMRE